MAQMTSAQKDELVADLQRVLSSTFTEIDLTSVQLRYAVDTFDEGIETAESSILNSVSQTARDWLLANVGTARWILEEVAEKRREVL